MSILIGSRPSFFPLSKPKPPGICRLIIVFMCNELILSLEFEKHFIFIAFQFVTVAKIVYI